MKNAIWIDTASGTWGRVEDVVGSLVLVDGDAEHAGVTVEQMLDVASDGERAQYGLEHGVRPVPEPTNEQFTAAAEVVEEAFEIGRNSTYGRDSAQGLMFKIMGRLGFIELPSGLR